MNSKVTVNMQFCFMAAQAMVIKATLKREWVNGKVISSVILQSFTGDEVQSYGCSLNTESCPWTKQNQSMRNKTTELSKELNNS